jgi:DNA-binding transcriptional LysR family regulator
MHAFSLKQLDYFQVVARLLHMSRAADQLGVSQPALSRALAKLEEGLGVPLFDRVGRSLRLTQYGSVLLKRIELAFGEIDNACLEISDLAGWERKRVALGFVRTLGIEFVPQIVRAFTEVHHDIHLTFTQSTGVVLEKQLRDGALDLVMNSSPFKDPALEWRLLARQELVLIVPSFHRLAHRREIRLRELANEAFVSSKLGRVFRPLTENLCQAAGFKPNFSFEADDACSVSGFVAAGFGVSIVPPECATAAGVANVRLKDTSAHRTVGLAWSRKRHMHLAARMFRDFALANGAAMMRRAASVKRPHLTFEGAVDRQGKS